MRYLTLSDLLLGLRDLSTKRHAALVKSATGKMYEPLLQAKLDAIEALPPALTRARPLADELDQTDATHDGFGAAIWHTTEAYFVTPNVDEAILAAAKRIRAAFIPTLGELGDSYVDEAKRASDRRASLKALKADLQLFPIAGGGTLYDWASAYLDAGDQLNSLLSDRADVPKTSRKGAGTLRTQTVALLNRFATALTDELESNAKLPRDLESQVFGYLDQLEASRVAQRPTAKSATGTGTPVTTGTTGAQEPDATPTK